ncbi:copper resistance protein CopC (plasmid) [Alkalihalobacillus hwajinpoensis]|uniref:copper resistance CopC family protein n=1 Tax=Guptibacillus hwajinpoensis TaxID=208199 RepID=UPI001883FE0E|nr:copper resistance protein CopC [Pseudalkalibacillus hwajinpoensis]MBF0706794.1 copper resistance protein CopC [Pseudalkalibacillus hwajinpoensis]
MKKTIFLALLLYFIYSPLTNAHSVLEASNPQEGEVIYEPLTKVELDFNTKVENGSNITLTNELGAQMKPDRLQIEESKMIGTFNQPLLNGSYSVDIEIIGADGHLVKESYSFKVRAENTPSNEKEDNEAKKNDQHVDAKQSDEEDNTATINDDKEKNTTALSLPLSNITFWLVVILGLFAVYLFYRIIQKKS